MAVVDNVGLPFLLEGQVAVSTRPQRLEVVIAAAAPPGALENTRRLLELWVAAADFGMFTDADPRLSHMNLRAPSGSEAGEITSP